jgi:uncharacterized protein (DUF1778 family)
VYGTAASVVVTVRVTPAQRIALRRAADATGTDVSGILREMIDEHAERRTRRDWKDLAIDDVP